MCINIWKKIKTMRMVCTVYEGFKITLLGEIHSKNICVKGYDIWKSSIKFYVNWNTLCLLKKRLKCKKNQLKIINSLNKYYTVFKPKILNIILFLFNKTTSLTPKKGLRFIILNSWNQCKLIFLQSN